LRRALLGVAAPFAFVTVLEVERHERSCEAVVERAEPGHRRALVAGEAV
jgi:hypothetical protein